MNKIPFQNNTVIPPEWLNAIQNLSYEKQSNEVGYLPNPDDVFHFQQWRTFTIDENNRITLGDYQRNVIIVPSAKDQSVTLDHFPSNGIIIYAPDWDSASASTAVTIGDSKGAKPIIKGGVGIFYCFGPSLPIIGKSLICNENYSLAQLKELFVDDLIVKSGVSLKHGSNAAFTLGVEPRVVLGNTYYDLIITKPGDARKIKILGDSLKVDFLGINPGDINFDDGFKNCWGEFDGDDFKTLKAERIEASNSISLPNKVIGGNHLVENFVFPNQPKFPRKFYITVPVTESAEFDVDPNYGGSRFSTEGTHTIIQRMHFSDADNRFQIGDTYRVYNDTLNVITVKDWSTGDVFTKIPAWTFKDFYYTGVRWVLG